MVLTEIKRHLKIYSFFAKNELEVKMNNPLDFSMTFMAKLLVFGIQLVWVMSILNFVPDIKGYTREQMLVFFATFFVTDRLIRVVFYRSLYQVQSEVRQGTFDIFLVLPVNTVFLSSMRKTDIEDFCTLIPGGILLVYAINAVKNVASFSNIAVYLLLIVVGVAVGYSIVLIIASASFRYINVEALFALYQTLVQFVKFPPEMFSLGFQVFLTFILPLMFVVAIPSKALLGLLSPLNLVLMVVFAVFFVWLAFRYWHSSLKLYTGASS